MACRDLTRAEQAAEEIRRSTGNGNVVIRHLDLASMYSVRQFGKDFLDTEDRLDVLINNAGEFTCLSAAAHQTLTRPPASTCRSDDVSALADRGRLRDSVCRQSSGSLPADQSPAAKAAELRPQPSGHRLIDRPSGGYGVPGILNESFVHLGGVLMFLWLVGRVDLDDLFFSRRHYSPLESYRQSKLANVLFSRELARRLKGSSDAHTGTTEVGQCRPL